MFFTSHIEIMNISPSGIAVQLNKSLMLNREYTVKLEDESKSIGIKGTVIWSVLTGSQKNPRGDVVPVYHAGLRFDDALTNKTTELANFIELHKDKSTEERLRGVRVKIHTTKNTVVFYPSGYKVKILSPFGMLIETMQELNPEDRYPMEVFLKDGKVARFLGRIVSRSEVKDSAPKAYDIGVDFVEIFPEDRANIEAYLQTIP